MVNEWRRSWKRNGKIIDKFHLVFLIYNLYYEYENDNECNPGFLASEDVVLSCFNNYFDLVERNLYGKSTG